MVADGHFGLVAEPFEDVEDALVLAGGLVEAPACVVKNAEPVDPGGLVRRVRRQPGESVVDERSFLVPGALGVQLAAGPVGDLSDALDVPGFQHMVAGLQQVMHIGGLVLRPHPDPPPPVPGRLPVRPGQRLAGLAGAPLDQLGGGPPVNEKRALRFRR